MSKISLLLIPLLLSFAYSQNNATPGAATQASDAQALELVMRAQQALTKGLPVSDISLYANAEWIAGATKASGTATLKAKGKAQSRIDISANDFGRLEVRNDRSVPDGRWAGTDGVRHPMALHNCWGPAAWFAPHAVEKIMLDSGVELRYLGSETRHGIAVQHVQFQRTNSEKNPKLAHDLQKLSTVDVFFDASTLLPIVITFNIHPDNDYGLDVPIEVHFSDYRLVDGVAIPFHIQRFTQGVLNLDLAITTAAINGGLADSEFALQ